jgi:cobaltochelatase CobN
MKKKQLLTGGAIAVLLLLLTGAWNLWFGITEVAFINYQVINLGQISKANNNSFIRISELSTDDLDKLTAYDMVFINGMGMRITEEQRAQIQRAADKGLPVLTTFATNPANRIVSLDSIRTDRLQAYLNNGGRRNYRHLLNYVRKYIDRKLIFIEEPEEATKRSNDLIYHIDPKKPDEEEAGFNAIAQYNAFLEANGLLGKDAPAIVVTGQMGEPTALIAKLEETGNVVYPVNSMRTFIDRHHIDSVQPSAIINMAHGRMGDDIVDYLNRQNIPLFAPLNVNRPVDDWENDPMGMSGGFLSQSVVMPEIDGAVRPFALFGHYRDEEGLHHAFAIPGRLEAFVQTVNNYIALQRKPNREKRVAIYYFKGPGQSAMTAGGMEVAPSLYNLLVRMKAEGYRVDGLPANPKELEKLIMKQGAVFGTYAEGAFDEFMRTGRPELISKETYEAWVRRSIRPEKYAEVVAANGAFPGSYMTTDDGRLGVARLLFGNVALIPQNAAGSGSGSFEVVHGTNAAPPHTYIASYLWMQHGFKADALVHFGTHGSLEFTPKKQAALSDLDWPDRLVGAVPHFYIYTIGNVGEGVIAKRRSYAGLQSYLTPPFLESGVRGMYRELTEKIRIYNSAPDDQASLAVKAATVAMGIHRELGLDSVLNIPYTGDRILKIENFAEELATEKITGQLYTMGVPYEPARIASSVYAMATEPVAYSLLALDKLRGKADEKAAGNKALFTQRYLNPSRALVERLIGNPGLATDEQLCRTAGIRMAELQKAREIDASRNVPTDMMAMMMAGAAGKHGQPKKEYAGDEVAFARAVLEVERTIKNVGNYKTALLQSPEAELSGAINAMNGGYTAPSPGGDPVANPNTIPTGRNLYSINAEATPSESAWEKGVRLAQHTISMYRERHNGEYPRKVSYTLWSGEFIETGGATIAQVLYMLGVEPVRDTFGRVSDLKLIPSDGLGRPRIDVVVQTSGQLRDIAASRLFLINRAVEMAAAAKDNGYENLVSTGVVETERVLTEKGVSPKEARDISTFRVFGGVNGGYGSGIQGMTEAGDRWDNESEIAGIYLNNMGAYYGSEEQWETFRQFAFDAALTRTDVVVQPRQSNTWGALSLDHVYEFMGGLNLAVRNVTGKDPDAYLSDYRNRNNVRMQELKEAIGVESRTTIFNPVYIKEKMKGEASSAGVFAETIRNTYGWNVMKPSVIDRELWDEIYEVYVKDKYNLGVRAFFETRNPAALEEITAVMLETARKGLWEASRRQIEDISRLHTDLVNNYRPSCSGFVCDNAKLREFIASKADPQVASEYTERIAQARRTSANNDRGVVMKKDEPAPGRQEQTRTPNDITVGIIIFAALAGIIVLIRYKRKKQA